MTPTAKSLITPIHAPLFQNKQWENCEVCPGVCGNTRLMLSCMHQNRPIRCCFAKSFATGVCDSTRRLTQTLRYVLDFCSILAENTRTWVSFIHYRFPGQVMQAWASLNAALCRGGDGDMDGQGGYHHHAVHGNCHLHPDRSSMSLPELALFLWKLIWLIIIVQLKVILMFSTHTGNYVQASTVFLHNLHFNDTNWILFHEP